MFLKDLKDKIADVEVATPDGFAVTRADAAEILRLAELAYANRRQLSGFLGWVKDDSTAVELALRLGKHLDLFETGGDVTTIPFAIMQDGEVIGMLNLQPVEAGDSMRFEFGYWLGQAHQGQSMMARALRLLAEAVRVAMPGVRMEVRTTEANVVSQKAALRAGFTDEGVQADARYPFAVRVYAF